MGRVKLPISRIVNNTNRQVTFSKRRNGILKKAYELAVLCDIDLALIMVSPSGRISYFSGNKRIEDVMLQYFNLKDEERESDHDSEGIFHDKEYVINTLMRLKSEDAATQSSEVQSSQSQKYTQEIMNLQHQLEIAKEQLRLLEPEPQNFSSLGEFESSEDRLSEALNLVEKRRRHILTDHSSSYHETVEQINTVVQYIINAQVEGNKSNLDQNPEFSSWVQHNHKSATNGSNCVPVGPESSSVLIRNQSSPKVVNAMCHMQVDNIGQTKAGCHQFNSLNHECPPQWHQSNQMFQPPVSQEIPFTLNGISCTSSMSTAPPLNSFNLPTDAYD